MTSVVILLIVFVLIIILWKFYKSKLKKKCIQHVEPGLLEIEMEGIKGVEGMEGVEGESQGNIQIDDIKQDIPHKNQNETIMGQNMDNISFNNDIPSQNEVILQENMDDVYKSLDNK